MNRDRDASARLPVSAVVCSLNEAHNIDDVLRACSENMPAEIIVVDGGSDDGTVALAQARGARVVNAGRVGLAAQRQLGVEQATQPFVAFIDADDRPTPSFLRTLLTELEANDFDAIQGVTYSAENATYWQRGWANSIQTNRPCVCETKMIGRPSLYRCNTLREIGFDSAFTSSAEDTDLARRFEIHGARQGQGTAVSFRIHESRLCRSVSKWLSYGGGYGRFSVKHKERFWPVVFHVFLGVGIVRYLKKLPSSKAFLLFYSLYSFFCGLGFISFHLQGAFRRITCRWRAVS